MALVTGHYCTSDDIDNWPDGATDNEKRTVINRVEERIEKLTEDFFYAKAFEVFVNGNGKDKLFLGLVPDIVSVTEIKISGIILSSSWWTYDKNSVYLDPEAVTASEEDLVELHLRLKHKEVLFPKGMGNIKVTGTYGRAVFGCPEDIKHVAIIMCQAENDSTRYEVSQDFKSERLGDYSYTRMEGVFVVGIAEVDKLLKPYIRKKPMLGVI